MIQQILRGFLSLVSRPADDWDFQERRRLIRLRCHYKCVMEVDGKKFEGVVRDMGVGGLRFRSFQSLKRGQIVTIHSPFEGPEQVQPVRCQIQWVHRPERTTHVYAGCSYVSEAEVMSRSWVKSVLRELGFRPDYIRSKRRWVRADCYLEGTLRKPDNTRQEIGVHNLGVGGVLFEYRGLLPKGETQQVRIGPFEKLPALDVAGVVVKGRPEGKAYLYSLEFGELKATQSRLLTLYLKTLLRTAWDLSGA